MVVGNAFDRLKGRCWSLLIRPDCDLSNICDHVAACIVHYKICSDCCLNENRRFSNTPISSSHAPSDTPCLSIIREGIVKYLS